MRRQNGNYWQGEILTEILVSKSSKMNLPRAKEYQISQLLSGLLLYNINTYIVIHRQICFVLSELISVARQYLPVAGIETRLNQTSNQSF